jgi:DUF2892 family protein
MALLDRNVGPHDALSRRVGGVLALLGGLMALDPFMRNLGFLAFVLDAVMGAVGLYYFIPGRNGGTAVFGVALIGLAVFDIYAAWVGYGTLAFVVSVAVAAVGFVTAATRRCPVNGMLGVDSNR